MTLTTTAVPIEIAAELSQKALDKITVLLEDGYTYNLESILKFLAEFSSDDFLSYYEDYEKFSPATQDFIIDNASYALEDMIEFIQEHGEADFVKFYDDYVIYAEKLGRDGYEILDAFVSLMGGFNDIDKAEEMYQGEYRSDAAFAEDFYEQLGEEIPPNLVIDWDATWFSSLRYDYSEDNCHYFRTSF
jgi:hypothetical protein